MQGSHGIAVLQVLRKMVLEVERPLVHALHRAGMGLLTRRLGKLRVELLSLCCALLCLLLLLLLQCCRPRRLLRRTSHTEHAGPGGWPPAAVVLAKKGAS